jgi:DNA-binding NtrC family response regulator
MSGYISNTDVFNKPLSMKEVERSHILSVLAYTHLNYTKTARILGFSRGKLYRRLKEYNIAVDRSVSAG